MTLLSSKKELQKIPKWLVWPFFLSGFLLVGLWAGCNKVEGKSKGSDEIVIPVAVEKAKATDIHEEVFLSGDVFADVEVKVLSLVSQRILKLNFEEGDRVKKGELLALVKAGALYDSVRGAKAGLRASKTQLKLSKIELDRTRKLRKTGTVPIANLQRAEAQFNSAKAQLAQAQAMLSQSYSNISNVNIRAPVSGIIGQKFLNKGDVASPAVPFCTIVQLHHVRIKASATEFDLVKLKKGQLATVTVPAYPDKVWKGKVDYLSPVLDRATRSVLVTILVDNKEKLLRPGMFADVVVQTGKRPNVITIPARAIRRRVLTGGEVAYSVFLADGEKSVRRRVTIGVRKKKRIEIKSGLNPGDPVIVLGNHRLKEGSKIKIGKNPLKDDTAAGEPETRSSKTNGAASPPTEEKKAQEPPSQPRKRGRAARTARATRAGGKTTPRKASRPRPRTATARVSRPDNGIQK